MAKEKSLVEEAILQMKNLEEAVAQNAKGILASTMKEEIKELVKESLSEQDDEIDTDAIDMDDMDMVDQDSDDEDGDIDMDMDIHMDEPTIDLRDKSTDEVLKVFKLMKDDDNIIVTKDEDGKITLKDGDDEYMITEDMDDDMDELDEQDDDDMDDETIESIVGKVFGTDVDDLEDLDDQESDDELDEVMYEIEMDDEDLEESDEEEDLDEVMYEIEMDDDDEDEDLFESKFMTSPKVGTGAPKVGSKGHTIYGKSGKMKHGTSDAVQKIEATESDMSVKPVVGKGQEKQLGKAKFEYKEGKKMDISNAIAKEISAFSTKKPMGKKEETKEASRTLGSGSNFRKGGLPKPRSHSQFNTAIQESRDEKELQILREKNEEYRKALNIFRNKLNEVAVFNSNLAYATRLFTEHSTSKQEKINILRRFDGVESIKESKNLYKSIKDELSTSASQPMNESLERKIEKVQSTGSAVNLIESKTYENPQFMRMKDLMSKIK